MGRIHHNLFRNRKTNENVPAGAERKKKWHLRFGRFIYVDSGWPLALRSDFMNSCRQILTNVREGKHYCSNSKICDDIWLKLCEC